MHDESRLGRETIESATVLKATPLLQLLRQATFGHEPEVIRLR